jgi:hypothetical protein
LGFQTGWSFTTHKDVCSHIIYTPPALFWHHHLGVAKAFVHIPHDERSKLDSKTRQCIFLGYGGDQFGYKLFDPIARKVVRNCDFVYVEDQTIVDIVKTKEKSSRVNSVGCSSLKTAARQS